MSLLKMNTNILTIFPAYESIWEMRDNVCFYMVPSVILGIHFWNIKIKQEFFFCNFPYYASKLFL